jgi:uncharacterized membrane protein SirB2/HAMP domain-containing protein
LSALNSVQLRLDTAILTLGITVGVISVALTVRCYMPCPFGDEWVVIDSIARGHGPSSWSWLFGQHNEHRIAIPRALIWLDLVRFHGKNVSLFTEIYLVLLVQWIAICYALERLTDFPNALKRTLQGLFAFCIFHPNQNENLTWPFEISFVLPSAIASVALLLVAFFPRSRRPWIATTYVALSPLVAGLSLASGLLIGPVTICFAILRRLPYRLVMITLTIFLLSVGAYLWSYKSPDPANSAQSALTDPKGLLVYVLTYFGASWTKILPHKERTLALLSIICFVAIVIHSARNRRPLSAFEWFCIAECSLMLFIALATAVGRLKFGVGQAYASRYQTPAMLYWGALCSLIIIAAWRAWPQRLAWVQAALLLVMCLSALTLFRIWSGTASRADSLRRACDSVIKGDYSAETTKILGIPDGYIQPAATLLRKTWDAAGTPK